MWRASTLFVCVLLTGCERLVEFVGVEQASLQDQKVDQRLSGTWYWEQSRPDRDASRTYYLHLLPDKHRIHFLLSLLYLTKSEGTEHEDQRSQSAWLAGEAVPFSGNDRYYLLHTHRLRGLFARELETIGKKHFDPALEDGPYEPGTIVVGVFCRDKRCDVLQLRVVCLSASDWRSKWRDLWRTLEFSEIAGRLVLEATPEKLDEIIRDPAYSDWWCDRPLRGQGLIRRIERWQSKQ